ncbi:MAG: lysine--tRNA ligase [Ferrovibrio sp.]|uniref:lysine--tRNA ligase n=1 Tax=Ferrovibrio sp. TaxID=1917215 RepID=UPI0026079537|nr:lysine--tRNA ligase [Ferrovibrio sp.]MCW0236639.1 lysine--tRNA ligase [Ferrovibrio sp.]
MTNQPPVQAAPDASGERANREAKLQHLRQLGLDPYLAPKFPKSHKNTAVHEAFAHLQPDERTELTVAVAGRVMAIRNSGMFIDLVDDTVKLQIYTGKEDVQGRFATVMKALDLGDIIGVRGTVRRTKRGEITVDTTEIVVLAKALEPPPEKWHGLKNVEQRYRHREYDLIGNDESRQTLRTRFRVIQSVRNFLSGEGFLEVETPMLHSIPGGAIARPFITHHNALDIPLYMRIAPELHLKRLVIGGLSEKVFEINRCFRNEGISPRHNPEFTTMELYQAYADYEDMMDIAERTIAQAAITATGGTRVKFGEHEIDFTPPFRRATMLGLIEEHGKVKLEGLDDAQARDAAKQVGVAIAPGASWGKVVEACFEHFVEPNLIQPTHVVALPKAISPLAKANHANPAIAERFETFCNTWEIANAFSELADPQEQRARFEDQQSQRDGGDDEAHRIDEDFLKAQSAGMMPMGGLGIGIDRLAMLLTNSPTIREVIAFPTLRPRSEDQGAEGVADDAAEV